MSEARTVSFEEFKELTLQRDPQVLGEEYRKLLDDVLKAWSEEDVTYWEAVSKFLSPDLVGLMRARELRLRERDRFFRERLHDFWREKLPMTPPIR